MKNEENRDHMKPFLAKQPNSITLSRNSYTIHQMRILVRVMEALQPSMEIKSFPHEVSKTNLGDVVIKLPAKSFLLNNADKNHKIVRRALNGLTQQKINLEMCDEKGVCAIGGTNLVKEWKYTLRSKIVEIEISRNLIPQFIALARGFTRFSIDVAFLSSSANTMKLYQFAAMYRNLKEVHVPLDTLRKLLGIEKNYPQPKTIKQRILNPAIKELKDRADVWFDIKERKVDPNNKKKLVGWVFSIHERRETSSKSCEKQKKNTLEKSKMEVILINFYKLSEVQAKKVATKITDDSDIQKLKKVLYDARWRILNRELKNVGGYVVRILNENFPKLKL